MKENQLRKLVEEICNDYTETIMDAILEDNVKGFPITKAVWHFMCELKEKNTLDEKRIDSSVNYSEFKNIQ